MPKLLHRFVISHSQQLEIYVLGWWTFGKFVCYWTWLILLIARGWDSDNVSKSITHVQLIIAHRLQRNSICSRPLIGGSKYLSQSQSDTTNRFLSTISRFNRLFAFPAPNREPELVLCDASTPASLNCQLKVYQPRNRSRFVSSTESCSRSRDYFIHQSTSPSPNFKVNFSQYVSTTAGILRI